MSGKELDIVFTRIESRRTSQTIFSGTICVYAILLVLVWLIPNEAFESDSSTAYEVSPPAPTLYLIDTSTLPRPTDVQREASPAPRRQVSRETHGGGGEVAKDGGGGSGVDVGTEGLLGILEGVAEDGGTSMGREGTPDASLTSPIGERTAGSVNQTDLLEGSGGSGTEGTGTDLASFLEGIPTYGVPGGGERRGTGGTGGQGLPGPAGPAGGDLFEAGLETSGSDGCRSYEELKSVIDSGKSRIKQRYSNALERNRRISGSVIVRFVVDARGIVVDCAIMRTTIRDSDLLQGIDAAIRDWRFRPKRECGNVTVEYSFRLTNSAS